MCQRATLIEECINVEVTGYCIEEADHLKAEVTLGRKGNLTDCTLKTPTGSDVSQCGHSKRHDMMLYAMFATFYLVSSIKDKPNHNCCLRLISGIRTPSLCNQDFSVSMAFIHL